LNGIHLTLEAVNLKQTTNFYVINFKTAFTLHTSDLYRGLYSFVTKPGKTSISKPFTLIPADKKNKKK